MGNHSSSSSRHRWWRWKAALVAALIVTALLRSSSAGRRWHSTLPILTYGEQYNFSLSKMQRLNLTGQHAIVTGANSGLGLVSTRELARAGARVVLACRSSRRALEAIDTLVAEGVPSTRLEFMHLDTSSLSSARSFVDLYLASGKPLHILMLNAGVMATPFQITEDGLEYQFATNHMGHFVVANGLLGRMVAQKESSRVVVLASSAHEWHYRGGLQLTVPTGNGNEDTYDPWMGYGSTKLANVLFTQELAARLAAQGVEHVFANVAHPGFVETRLLNVEGIYGAFANRVARVANLLAWSVEDGALTQLYLAADPEIEQEGGMRGQYFVPIAKPSATHPIAAGRFNTLRDALWRFSEGVVVEKLGTDALYRWE